MKRVPVLCIAVAAIWLAALPSIAAATEGEFDNACATSLALGQIYKTDCSVSAVYGGKTYCFGNGHSRELFMKNPDKVIAKAREIYATKKP
ncbi:MAG TPA: hypothetical protein VEW64_04465 [Methyloceanibacter sp.]|nr:hypothetical protein [Methyloceanibacter sp.]